MAGLSSGKHNKMLISLHSPCWLCFHFQQNYKFKKWQSVALFKSWDILELPFPSACRTPGITARKGQTCVRQRKHFIVIIQASKPINIVVVFHCCVWRQIHRHFAGSRKVICGPFIPVQQPKRKRAVQFSVEIAVAALLTHPSYIASCCRTQCPHWEVPCSELLLEPVSVLRHGQQTQATSRRRFLDTRDSFTNPQPESSCAEFEEIRVTRKFLISNCHGLQSDFGVRMSTFGAILSHIFGTGRSDNCPS